MNQMAFMQTHLMHQLCTVVSGEALLLKCIYIGLHLKIKKNNLKLLEDAAVQVVLEAP